LKRVAGKISRDVRKYWLKINQLITLRQKQESDEIRQKVTLFYLSLTFCRVFACNDHFGTQAMNKHLEFLVKQTERYASMVAHHFQHGEENDSGSDSDESRVMMTTDGIKGKPPSSYSAPYAGP
jgi:hypothetical protein